MGKKEFRNAKLFDKWKVNSFAFFSRLVWKLAITIGRYIFSYMDGKRVLETLTKTIASLFTDENLCQKYTFHCNTKIVLHLGKYLCY